MQKLLALTNAMNPHEGLKKLNDLTFPQMIRTLGLAAFGVLVLCIAATSQINLLNALQAKRFSLVEIGGLEKIRVLRFLMPIFESRRPPDESFLVGASLSGDSLIFSTRSGQSHYSKRAHDEIDVRTVVGGLIESFRPNVRGMTILYAELSPDQRSVAVVGGLSRPEDRLPTYGVHLVSRSNEIITAVETSEAEVPHCIGWSPKGDAIVYDASDRILLYHVATRSSRVLVSGDHPTWSADGSWIAYRTTDGFASLMRPDGGMSKSILPREKIHDCLRWSPDSRYLLFTDSVAIKVLDLANSETVPVFASIDHYTNGRLRWVRNLPER